MLWTLSGTDIDVDGQTFVPSNIEKRLTPVWRGRGKPPASITIDRHWQKWYKAFVGHILSAEFQVETREFKTDLAVPRNAPARGEYLPDAMIEREKASPWTVPAPRRTARSYTFRNDADGVNVRSAPIYVARVGELKLDVDPGVSIEVGGVGGGAVTVFRVRGTAKLAIDPVIHLSISTAEPLAAILVEEFLAQAYDEGWYDPDADGLIQQGENQLRELVTSAFTPPAGWVVADADDPEAQADEGEAVQRDFLVTANAPGIGFFALHCQLPDEADQPFQVSEPIAIEIDNSGGVHVYADISVLDLSKAAGM